MLHRFSRIKFPKGGSPHDRVNAIFLVFGAVLPIVLTFGLVYFAPHLYDDGVQKVAPWIDAMRAQVAETHDARALYAFDVSLGGGALLSMYLGLIVGRLLGLIQKAVEHWLARDRVQTRSA